MDELGDVVFSFGIGGLFVGYSSLEIRKNGIDYVCHHKKSHLTDHAENHGNVDAAQIDALMGFL